MARSNIVRALVFAATPLLASCSTAVGLSETFVDYNEGVARATDQLFVLNAVRAAERKQVIYTRFSALRGQASGSFAAGLPIPFGPKSADNFILSPTLSVSGTPSFDIAVLDDQEFWRGITTAIDGGTLQFFLDQNWPIDMLGHLLFEEISLKEQTHLAVRLASNASCNLVAVTDQIRTLGDAAAPFTDQEQAARCAFLKHLLEVRPSLCAEGKQPNFVRRRAKIDGGKPVAIIEERVFDNRPDSPCLMSGFQEILTRYLVLYLHIAKVPGMKTVSPWFAQLPPSGLDGNFIAAMSKASGENYKIEKDDAGSFSLARATSETKLFSLKLPDKADLNALSNARELLSRRSLSSLSLQELQHVRSRLARILAQATFEQVKTDDRDGAIALRSPNSVVYYLGEVIRAKHPGASDGDWRPRGPALAFRFDQSLRPIFLFDLEEGSHPDADAVTVEQGGKTFWLRRGVDNRASQVATLVTQLLNLYKKADKAPTTAAVTVIGP